MAIACRDEEPDESGRDSVITHVAHSFAVRALKSHKPCFHNARHFVAALPAPLIHTILHALAAADMFTSTPPMTSSQSLFREASSSRSWHRWHFVFVMKLSP